jgi:hypothetical protein
MKVDSSRVQKKRKNKVLNKKKQKNIITYHQISSEISEFTKFKGSQQFKFLILEIQTGNKLCKYILEN